MAVEMPARHCDGGLQHSVDSVFCIFCTDTAAILVRQSKSEDIDLQQRFAVLWGELNKRLRTEVSSNDDIVPTVACSDLKSISATCAS